MSLIDDIKRDVQKAGSNKGKIIYFREGVKTRIRFLQDMDEGMRITFHDSFALGINVPCQETFGRSCKYCDMEGLRTREQYCWSVYDYEAKEVKLLLAPVNNCSPIPMLVSLYDTYGTITDRDYVITVTGKQQNKTFSVIPMDKNKFRNDKAKALSNSKTLSIIDKAFPAGNDEDEDDVPIKKSGKSSSKKKVVKDEDEDDETVIDYDEMTEKELYKMCKERDIECKPKKTKKYYINLLEEYDSVKEDWEDEDDEEDWEEDGDE